MYPLLIVALRYLFCLVSESAVTLYISSFHFSLCDFFTVAYRMSSSEKISGCTKYHLPNPEGGFISSSGEAVPADHSLSSPPVPSVEPSPGTDRGSTSSAASCSVVKVTPGPVRGDNIEEVGAGGSESCSPAADLNSSSSDEGVMEVVDIGSVSASPVVCVEGDSVCESHESVDVSLFSSGSCGVTEQDADLPARQNLLAELDLVGVEGSDGSEVGVATICEQVEGSSKQSEECDMVFDDFVEIQSPTPPSSSRSVFITISPSPPTHMSHAVHMSPSPPAHMSHAVHLSPPHTDPKLTSGPLPASVCSAFITPAARGGAMLLSDDNITPTPNYHRMCTPRLKQQCSKYGVKPLPKRKMIAKLEEIYSYTHPLVGKWVELVLLVM